MAIATTTALAVGGMAMQANAASKGAKAQKQANALAAQQAADQLEFQKEQMALLEEQKQRYRDFEFTNPYAGMQNVFEDLTVNQQSARFQSERGAQQRANVMQQLRGAAGTSGIASLAQSLANQGALQARQISADIGQQEQANQLASAKGAQAALLAQRQGDQMVQEAEMQRQATLLGIQFQGAAGASAGAQQAMANQMAMQQAGIQMQMQNAQAFGNMAMTASGLDFGGIGGGGSTTTTPQNTTELLDMLAGYGN
tara:strand:- start:5761 stop:6528 length:768 start_codon:yes stop_codon:yes gene_type:complete